MARIRNFDKDITPKSKQGHAIEHAQRVKLVLAFIEEALEVGATRSRQDIHTFCAESFDAHERTADRYAHEAWAVHGKLDEPKRNVARGKAEQVYTWLLRKAMVDIDEHGLTNVNVQALTRALDGHMKLFGLAAPEVVEHHAVDAWKDLFRDLGVKIPSNGDGRKTEEQAH